MRTLLFFVAGGMLMAAFFIVARLFSAHYPSSAGWATTTFVVVWLAITAVNMWVGVNKAGYSVADELPIFLLLFGAPAVVAIVLKWKVL
jgi:hypothetical protein